MIDAFPPTPTTKPTFFADVLVALVQDLLRATIIAFALTGKLEVLTVMRCFCGYFVYQIITKTFTHWTFSINLNLTESISK